MAKEKPRSWAKSGRLDPWREEGWFWLGGLAGGAVFPHEDNRKAHRLGLDRLGRAAVAPTGCVMPRVWEGVMGIVLVLGGGDVCPCARPQCCHAT